MKFLQEYYDDNYSKLLKEVGAFYAFNKKQFEESKKENVKYINMKSGLLCPKSKVEYFINKSYTLFQEALESDYKDNGEDAIIEREFFNHECQISMDYTNVMEVLKPYMDKYPDIFTMEVIRKIFSECHTKAVENDWF